MMKILICLTLLLSSTLVLAQTPRGQYNSQERSYELTYDDLAQELAVKKSTLRENDSPRIAGFSQVQAVFGYSFASMDLSFATGSHAFSMNGIDIRASGRLTQSTWLVEAGFKNFARVTNGSKSAEAQILTTSLKNQDILKGNIQYIAGLSSSFNSLSATDKIRTKTELGVSLNVSAGLRGALTNQLSWGVDLNAYSPISGRLLKGGLDTTLLLSSVL